jgi:hypothetical protein
MRFFKISLSLLLLIVTGCGSDDLPDFYLLDRLRVVAASMVGAPAEFSAGDAGLQVQFHVSDPLGAGRALDYSIEACVDPGVGQSATPSCAGNPTRSVLITGGSFTPGSAATNYYGVLTSPAFALPPAGVIFADPATGASRPVYEQANGVSYLVILTLTAPGGEKEIAFKRVIASTKATKNQQPTFNAPAVLFDGVDATTFPLTTAVMRMQESIATGSAESYVIQYTNGSSETKTELLTLTWLVTSGEVRYARTDAGTENRFTPANPLPVKTSFIVVVRDERGGTAVVDIHRP